MRTSGLEDAGLSAGDPTAVHEHDRHELDPVTMSAFGGWATDPFSGIDPKRMGLDEPTWLCPKLTEGAPESFEQVHERRRRMERRLEGFEQAFHPSVERVVRHGLKVGPMGCCHQRVAREVMHEARVPTESVSATVAQVGVRRERVPMALEAMKLAYVDLGGHPEHGRIEDGEAQITNGRESVGP